VLHAEWIGSDVTVIGQVTFGTRNDARWPAIGDGAFIGVGARVLGGLKVGANARIGANAVVVDDVPDGATVVGMPARVVGDRETSTRPA
jgi:serine O-acetyltransferase